MCGWRFSQRETECAGGEMQSEPQRDERLMGADGPAERDVINILLFICQINVQLTESTANTWAEQESELSRANRRAELVHSHKSPQRYCLHVLIRSSTRSETEHSITATHSEHICIKAKQTWAPLIDKDLQQCVFNPGAFPLLDLVFS